MKWKYSKICVDHDDSKNKDEVKVYLLIAMKSIEFEFRLSSTLKKNEQLIEWKRGQNILDF